MIGSTSSFLNVFLLSRRSLLALLFLIHQRSHAFMFLLRPRPTCRVFLRSRYKFHPTTASISFLHLFWISIDSKKILYFASRSFFSLSPAAGCTIVAGGVISCIISQSAFAGSRGRSCIAAKRPNIAAPSTTDVACECGSITGMLQVFASMRMSATF
jgi:hypothetical protein